MTYFLSAEAEAELGEAIDFYSLNVSRKVAESFLAKFVEKQSLLSSFPALVHQRARAGVCFLLAATPIRSFTGSATGSSTSARLLISHDAPNTGRRASRSAPLLAPW